MAVYEDCRHYAHRSTASGEAIQRCRLDANENDPFACPVDCLFKEERKVSDAGWQIQQRRKPRGPR
ncbi:MAG: hypothetical protein QOG64_1820 [Acidimicrobiaceae bacterium]|nr:hypothetical protein [Acidimicrobiaceae bacterium]